MYVHVFKHCHKFCYIRHVDEMHANVAQYEAEVIYSIQQKQGNTSQDLLNFPTGLKLIA